MGVGPSQANTSLGVSGGSLQSINLLRSPKMSHPNRRHVILGLSAVVGCATTNDFEEKTEKFDWTLGFENPPAHNLDTPALNKVHGSIPSGLEGRFYRNGPAIRARAGVRVQHWFDGDGMVHSFHVSKTGISHIGRMVHTEKYLRDEAEGRLTSGGFGTVVPNPTPSTSTDVGNAANTSVIKIGDVLMALWEGGSAHSLDLQSLETLEKKTWSPQTAGMPFSAHPKVEFDGTIWNFGQDVFGQRIFVYRISQYGALEAMIPVEDVPGGLIHDFCMTDSHLIFLAPSLRANKRGADYLGSFSWMPEEAQRVVVLDKNDLTNRRDFELPPGLQFHFGNAYEDNNGDIRFSTCSTEPDFLLTGLKQIMRAKIPEPAKGKLTHLVLRKNGRAEIVSEVQNMGDHEFPQFNPNYNGVFARYLYTVGQTRSTRPFQSAILQHDIQNGDIQAFDYGDTAFCEEHVFVPRQSQKNETDGWLIGTVLDYAKGTTSLNILDATYVGDGPVAIFELPYALPLGFHGAWVHA